MSNLEVLQSGIECTTNMYSSAYPANSETESLNYSSNMLASVLINDKSKWAKAYTRQNNLRENMLALSKEDVKNELLKNMVNVASYNRMINSRDSMYLGGKFDLDNMSNDAVAVVSANNIAAGKIEEMYQLLDNPEFLQRACQCFVSYRISPEKRELLDNVAVSDQMAAYLNNDLDVYYARTTSEVKRGTK